MTSFIMNRRTLLKGAAASGIILPATGLYTPALAQSNRERVIFATTRRNGGSCSGSGGTPWKNRRQSRTTASTSTAIPT